MRPLNLKLTKWLRSDREFRTARASRRGARGVGESRTSAALPTDSSNADKRDFHDAGVHLANQLNHLDIHLTLWHAKFKAWMHDPRHALIYMDDEQDEGVQFPDGLDQAIEQMLQSQRLRVVERGKEDKPTDRSIELQ
jgi:hypothetical protein